MTILVVFVAMQSKLTLVLLASLVTAQVLPNTYPAVDTITPVLADIVATVDWQSAAPAVMINRCKDVNAWGITYDDGPSASTPIRNFTHTS